MHDAEMFTNNEQGMLLEPDSHVMGKRLVALIIDSIVLAFMISWCTRTFGTLQLGSDTTIPGLLFNAGATSYSIPNGSGGMTTWVIKLDLFWELLFVLLYFSLQEFFFGATIGKLFMGLRVISQHDDSTYTRLTTKDALLRNLIRFIDASGMYFLGFIFCFCSSRNRRLGDIVARTLVVRRESVPYLAIPRAQTRYGAQVIILLCLVMAIGCPVFAYFWQPSIMIQNDVTTQQLFSPNGPTFSSEPTFPTGQILYYTLGTKTWTKDNQGQHILTYPIQYVSRDNPTHSCKGSISFIWQWPMLSWRKYETNNNCNNV